MNLRTWDLEPQRFSWSEGVQVWVFWKTSPGDFWCSYQVKDYRFIPTLSLPWWGNEVSEFIDLPKVTQLADSNMRIKTRVCWFPSRVCLTVRWHLLGGRGRGTSTSWEGPSPLSLHRRLLKTQRTAFLGSRSVLFLQCSPTPEAPVFRISNPIRQRFPTPQDW